MSNCSEDLWLVCADRVTCTHWDERPIVNNQPMTVDLLVIHNISLPPAESEEDFDNQYVEDFFSGQLDCSAHPIFSELEGVRVSAHLFIKRSGQVIQFVPLNYRAWHAGLSEFNGRQRCNDFSVGIEMQGTDLIPYTDAQYDSLVKVTKEIQGLFPGILKQNIVGHEHIAPKRKTDPGPSFDWNRYKNRI